MDKFQRLQSVHKRTNRVAAKKTLDRCTAPLGPRATVRPKVIQLSLPSISPPSPPRQATRPVAAAPQRVTLPDVNRTNMVGRPNGMMRCPPPRRTVPSTNLVLDCNNFGERRQKFEKSDYVSSTTGSQKVRKNVIPLRPVVRKHDIPIPVRSFNPALELKSMRAYLPKPRQQQVLCEPPSVVSSSISDTRSYSTLSGSPSPVPQRSVGLSSKPTNVNWISQPVRRDGGRLRFQ